MCHIFAFEIKLEAKSKDVLMHILVPCMTLFSFPKKLIKV